MNIEWLLLNGNQTWEDRTTANKNKNNSQFSISITKDVPSRGRHLQDFGEPLIYCKRKTCIYFYMVWSYNMWEILPQESHPKVIIYQFKHQFRSDTAWTVLLWLFYIINSVRMQHEKLNFLYFAASQYFFSY